MSYRCEVLADSVNPTGQRLTTFEIELPRPVLAEFNTHCMLARNSASSRAIPVAKMIRRLITDTYRPAAFGINQPGMQATEYLTGDAADEASAIWTEARNMAVAAALKLLIGQRAFDFEFGSIEDFLARWQADETRMEGNVHFVLKRFEIDVQEGRADKYLNVHKQNANRVLEPYLWHTVITTATEWDNFFALRAHPDADPAIASIARLMRDAYLTHEPARVKANDWHLPLIQQDELVAATVNPQLYAKVSAARCARVSYLTHDGKRDIEQDIQLYNRLVGSGHMSPLEHVGVAQATPAWSGKFYGFTQFRKLIPMESNFGDVLAQRALETS